MHDKNTFWVNAAKAGFALCYCLVLLPFTTGFIYSLFQAASESTSLAGVLARIQHFAIPALLAGLEFVSVGIAISFWQQRGWSSRASTLTLFLLCQLLAVVATFYHVRFQDYRKEKDAFVQAQHTKVEAVNKRIEGTTQSIGELDAAAMTTNQILRADDQFIAAILGTGDTTTTQERVGASRSRSRLIRERERERRGLLAKRDALAGERAALQTQLVEVISNPTDPGFLSSPVDYIAQKAGDTRSWFALFVAAIFPISVLGVANRLAAVRTNRRETPLEVQRLLCVVEKVPREYQFIYAKHIASAVHTFVEGARCSEQMFHEGIRTRMELDSLQAMTAGFEQLKRIVRQSKLDNHVKNYLLERLTVFIDMQLRKEDGHDHQAFARATEFATQ